MKVVLYARVSSQGQSDNDSLEAQLAAGRTYCAAHGYEVVSEYREVGTGTKRSKRPIFNEAIDKTLSSADALLVAKLDRAFRSVADCSDVIENCFKPNKKSLILLDFQVDTATPQGQLFLNMMSSFAQFEASLIFERTQGTKRRAKAQGYRGDGGLAYGQKSTTIEIQLGESTIKRKIAANDDFEQLGIDLIRRHYLAGKSLREIAEALEKQGIPTKLGRSKWSAQSVSNVIKRLKSEGLLRHKRKTAA